MSEIRPIKPSPALLDATRVALAILAPHWPQKFKFLAGSSQSDADLLSDYASACSYAHIDRLQEAARTWVVNSKFAPTPHEFGEMARGVTPAPDPSSYRPHPAPAPKQQLNGEQLSQLKRFNALAVERLHAAGHRKFTVPVGQMWGMLYAAQPTAETAEMVREVEVTEAVWLEVVDAWIKGARPPGHPMKNMGLLNEGVA